MVSCFSNWRILQVSASAKRSPGGIVADAELPDAQILRCGDIFEDLMKAGQCPISPFILTSDTHDVSAEVSTYILCGGDRTLFKSLGLATIRAGILDGEFYAATDDSGDVLGYVMTMPRGKLLYSTYVRVHNGVEDKPLTSTHRNSEEQRKLGYDDFTSRLSEEGKAYYSDFVSDLQQSAQCPVANRCTVRQNIPSIHLQLH